MDRVGKRSEKDFIMKKKLIYLARHIGIGHGHVFSLRQG